MNTQTKKAKFSTLRNVAWMVGIAWRTQRMALVLCLAIAATGVLSNLVGLYAGPLILDRVEQGAPLGQLAATIAAFTAGLFLTAAVKEYLNSNKLFPQLAVRTAIIDMVNHKSLTTSYPNTLEESYTQLGGKVGEATQSNQAATEAVWNTLAQLLQNIAGFAIYIGILSGLDPVLLVVITATCAVGFLVSRYTDGWVYAHREASNKYYQRKRYIRDKAESVTLAKDIRIFGLQNWLEDLLASVHNVYLDFRLRQERVLLLADLTEAALTVLRNGLAYWYLLNMALEQGLRVSEFLLYFTAASTFTTWVMGILQQAGQLRRQCMDISQVRAFLDYPEPFRFEGGAPIPKAAAYELRLERVCYRYPGAAADTIHDLDLTIRPGEKLAIVGLNGAGKTTLVKLLCGLLDPTGGRVLLNGQDIRDFDRRAYYGLLSAVFQEFSVLDVTVAENVAQTERDIDMDRVRACLDQAGLTKAIDELPQGPRTHVGREVFLDGVLFSGGQTQRLMLARALYKGGPILVLDEPTAALDPLAESDIYNKYSQMTAGKTSVFISHRLASTRFCDRIVFLDHGAIAEEGTHQELLDRGGAYARLFEVQSRYYQEGKEF